MGKKDAINGFYSTIVLLSLFHVAVEDFFTILGMPWDSRLFLLYAGFFFDIFFTIEFIGRFAVSMAGRKCRRYFQKEQGWIDFLVSVPLLVLNTGPAVMIMVRNGSVFFGMGGILNIIEIIAVIRIARILRLFRILKVVKGAFYSWEDMTQRHIRTITTIAVTGFLSIVFMFDVTGNVLGFPDYADEIRQKNTENGRILSLCCPGSPCCGTMIGQMEDLLIIREEKEETAPITLFSRYDNPYYSENFGPGEYQYEKIGTFSFFFDLREINRIHARENIMYLLAASLMMVLFIAICRKGYSVSFGNRMEKRREHGEKKEGHDSIDDADDY